MFDFLKRPLPFTGKQSATSVAITPISDKQYKTWLSKQPKALKTLVAQNDFAPGKKKTLLSYDNSGNLDAVYALTETPVGLYDLSITAEHLKTQLSSAHLKKTSFTLNTENLSKDDLNNALIGWGLSAYQFDAYKSKSATALAKMMWPKGADKTRVEAFLCSQYLIRDMINIPANDLGPEEIEKAAKDIAKTFKAKVSVTADQKLLDKNFPLVHTVGHASAANRRPRLIDLTWGKKMDPKVTIVGKGVCFDTGGLDLKPSAYMKLMKKDMGGAAHALALARMIMALKLPIQLRLIIPAVENSVSAESFRPGDIFKSRKGLFVENTNTDAEGRLILADALTYACEDEPELVIDYATLTGSARAALGQEIPAMFSTNDKTAKALQDISFEANDPVWSMPLHQGYKRHIENSTGDLVNSAGLPGDLIYSALFLQQFITDKQEWIHLDTFAWESAGRPGRSKGGADMGLRAVFALLEKRYG